MDVVITIYAGSGPWISVDPGIIWMTDMLLNH